MKFTPLLSLAFTLFLLAMLTACKKDSKSTVMDDPTWPTDSIRTVVQGLAYPWEILWGPDDHIWMTERGGRISRVDPKTGTVRVLLTVADVKRTGEGGLLGMALHPSFSSQPYVYVVYNYDQSGVYKEKVVRYTYANNVLTAPQLLLDNLNASGIHNGSRLLISADQKLYISTGDASRQSDAQNTQVANGKILRINLDGTIPVDNPFPGNPVWSYGHRNPQGLVLANGVLYAAEHGPDIEDEVNIIERQRNYGWPTVNGPCDQPAEMAFCNANNVKAPIWSSGGSTVAPSGMDYYGSDRIGRWKQSLLLVTLKGSRLYQLQLSADGRQVSSVQTYFVNTFGRLRDVCVSPAGRVYLCTSNGSNDKLIEVSKF
ncbi:PQQ-dependent sugar dehydrogenase [Chitinophaga pendula]|uniref:PQQ-dependent sugar dehydrogenase n=1 Tax=Chitinophaga TaxID=79328 RepID=UPI000BAED700|nr:MULTISPECIES: PQQ-dependent sugar dehydrogenase [Chitinophaga]ASZ11294.1 glucose dehydrogenase [Chitinophaga sp. MD30]UCJ05704.1 PQQ-dependent sugar dehydrogenase [Chitinophaga pendula]